MSLVTDTLSVPTPSGAMDCYVARPADGRHSLVVLFMDIWGLREELFAIARRVAGEGYVCALPDLFHRHGKLQFGKRNAEGKAVSFETLPPDVRQHMISYAHQTVRASVREDVQAILDAARSWPVKDGPAGSVGFCMGGRAAFYVGQVFPERFRANASLHGTQLASDKPLSAHTEIGALRGEFYCGFGELDEQGAPAIRDRLKTLFDENPKVVYRSVVHPGAKHGYSMPDRDIYDHAAAERDWTEIFAMLHRQLG